MDTSKAIELFEKSEHIGILIPPEASFDILASAEVLAETLEEREKSVGFLSAITSSALPHSSLKRVSSGKILPRELIVSVAVAGSPVSQLRYEKEDQRIDIVLSPKHTSLRKEDVSFREGKMRCDCIIALGIADIEQYDAAFPDPALLSETPVINIDISAENKNYGDANLIDAEASSVAEIIYKVVAPLRQELFTPETATLLLGAIASRTGHFSAEGTKANAFLVASELMRLGADLSSARSSGKIATSSLGILGTPRNDNEGVIASEAKQSHHEQPIDINLLQLFGRASVRSRFDENNGILWSFLTTEDFEKTGRSPQDLDRVMEKIGREFPPHHVSALLWQDPEATHVKVLLSGRRATLEKLEARGVATFQSPYLLLHATFATFREAEEILYSLLQDIL